MSTEPIADDNCPHALDQGEFRRWYDTIAPDLHHYIVRVCGNAADADDLLQEAFTRFVLSEFSAVSEIDNTRYLYRIATNLIHDRWRRANRWKIGAIGEKTGRSPEERYSDQVDIERALAKLKPQERALLWLAYGQGLPHSDIADILDIKSASVRVLLSRARIRILRHLKG